MTPAHGASGQRRCGSQRRSPPGQCPEECGRCQAVGVETERRPTPWSGSDCRNLSNRRGMPPKSRRSQTYDIMVGQVDGRRLHDVDQVDVVRQTRRDILARQPSVARTRVVADGPTDVRLPRHASFERRCCHSGQAACPSARCACQADGDPCDHASNSTHPSPAAAIRRRSSVEYPPTPAKYSRTPQSDAALAILTRSSRDLPTTSSLKPAPASAIRTGRRCCESRTTMDPPNRLRLGGGPSAFHMSVYLAAAARCAC